MPFYVRIENSEGSIKSYFRFEDEYKAYLFYDIISTEDARKFNKIKLMNENFVILETKSCINKP